MRQLGNVPGEELATVGTRRREFVKIITADAPADLSADTKNTTKLYHVHIPELPIARPSEVGAHGSQKPGSSFPLIARHRRSHAPRPHIESLVVTKGRKIGRRLKQLILGCALLAILVSATSYASVSLFTAERLTRLTNYPLPGVKLGAAAATPAPSAAPAAKHATSRPENASRAVAR